MKSRVKKFMEINGMTLSDMEKATGLSRPTIIRSREDGEDGIDTCTIKILSKIADALGLHPRDLFN